MNRKERIDHTPAAIDENGTSAAAIAFDRIVFGCLELKWTVDPDRSADKCEKRIA
jgi:hypothetical protein